MPRNVMKCRVIVYIFFCIFLLSEICHAQSDSDDDIYEDGVLIHVSHSGKDREIWTFPAEPSQNNSVPLSMAIWIGLVLGIFVLMVIAVCCALFCKYSEQLSSHHPVNMPRSPIPIIITPPSRNETQVSLQSAADTGYTNQGYEEFTNSSEIQNIGSRDIPPYYTDIGSSGRIAVNSQQQIAVKLETPPPTYMMVAPFKS